MTFFEGPDLSFFEDHDKEKPTREASLEEGTLSEEASQRKRVMDEVDGTKLTDGFGEQLKTYVKNQLLLQKEEHPQRPLGLEDVRKVLEHARSQGNPSLSTAADEALQGSNMHQAGYSPKVGYLSSFDWENNVGHGTLSWARGQLGCVGLR